LDTDLGLYLVEVEKMVRVNNGFLFEARTEANGSTGLIGSYKAVRRGTKRHLTFTLGLDTKAHMCTPVVSDLSNGFVGMDKVCSTADELKKWVAGNKSFYYRVGDFGLIADGLAILHDSGEVDMSKVSLYLPASYIESSSSFGGKPALLMLRLSETEAAGHQKMNPLYIKGHLNYVADFLRGSDCTSKLSFLDSLLGHIQQ